FTISVAAAAWAPPAQAADPQTFVQAEHDKLRGLLHQPKTGARDAAVQRELDGMVDYEELARRTFGQPCPPALGSCTNHWGELSDAQKAEVTTLLKQLVTKNYQKNLEKTLDYDVTYKGVKAGDAGDTKVRTEAKAKDKPRDPSVLVDYVVHERDGKVYVVDVITEGSSLAKAYYEQFDKKLKNKDEGYPNIVAKLREKIAKP
ncbi:MAG TPA: ABC transporter substrate-binding protein, partial [Polyangiaceae bacterium]